MKHNNIITGLLSLAFATITIVSAQGQAFHKGSFQINLSEGWTSADYTTNDINTKAAISSEYFSGDRDPLSLEYGISNHWGIGITSGADIYKIPMCFYSLPITTIDIMELSNLAKVATSEFTIDCSYHFFETAKTDISVVASFGGSSICMKGGISDYTYQYNASGGIVRLGIHARIFPWKHLGFLAMVSAFSETMSPEGVKGTTIGNNYSTTISGTAVEFGLCYRFKR